MINASEMMKQFAGLEAQVAEYKQRCLDYIDWCDARDKQIVELKAQVKEQA